MPVVDASVIVEYLAGGNQWEETAARLLSPSERRWAPHLVDAQVGHVLRRAVANGEVSAATARVAFVDLGEMPLQRAAHMGLLERAWRLRESVSFYDGLYVALAERLEMPLLTLDARLAKASGVRARIEVIGA